MSARSLIFGALAVTGGLTTPLASAAVISSEFVLFQDDFESGAPGWTTGSDGDPGTAWELGTPSNVGPPAAHSATNAYATNLASDYAFNANVWLRSPAIDLTGLPDATLRFFEFADIEQDFDFASLTVISALDDTALAVLQVSHPSLRLSWTETSFALPASALGQPVYFEFRLRSDDIANYAGWYIDDVQVTSSIPEPGLAILLVLPCALLLPRVRRP